MDLARIVLTGIVVGLVLAGSCGAGPPASAQLEWWDVGAVHEVEVDPLTGAKWFSRCFKLEGINVYRFDEVEWLGYHVGDTAHTLTVDQWGRVWVGGISFGLFYLENGQFQYLHRDHDNTPSFDRICGIGLSSAEDMWIGGHGAQNYLIWYALCEGWRNGLGHRWGTRLPEEWSVIEQFVMGPEGDLWFMTLYGVGVVQPGEDEPLLQWSQTTACPGRNTDMAITPGGSFWLTIFPASDSDPDIFYSENGSDWDPVEHPNIPGKTGKAWSVAAAGEAVWFSAYYGPSYGVCTGAGAFWHDGDQWRWLDFGSTLIEDIAVDEATGDVWFAATDGAYVLRGGPEAWPPVWIELEVGAEVSRGSEAFSLKASAEFQMELQLDLYVAVQFPDGSLFFAPNWSTIMVPFVRNLSVPIGLQVEGFQLTDFDMTGLSAGTYRWFTACTHAGTMDFASNIASCEWEFE